MTTATIYGVWYMRPDFWPEGMMGHDWLDARGMLPDPADLSKTHIYLKEVEAFDLKQVVAQMQGDVWSPNGEARALIRAKGLQHTSMMVGDIVVYTEAGTPHVMMVERDGFREVHK